MNFPNFNPSMFNNFDYNQMKSASDMMAGMSDEQIRSYASKIGMPQIDPQMMRNNINMMKGIDPSQFENLKNQAKNFQLPGVSASSSTSSSQSDQKQASTPTTNTKQSTIEISHIESLKVKGNDFFKKEQYDEAGTAYFEAILEIEELRSKNKNLQDNELDSLEISCRLNYANVKAKEEEYDVVLCQAKKVLAIKENGKAYFRLGQAQFHLKKYEEALENLNKAIPLLPGDTIASELRDKVKKVLQQKEDDSFVIEVKSNEEKTQETELSDQEAEAVKLLMTPEIISQFNSESDATKAKQYIIDFLRQNPEKCKGIMEIFVKEGDPNYEKLQNMSPQDFVEHLTKAMKEDDSSSKDENEVKSEEEKAQSPPPQQESSSESSFGPFGVTKEKLKQQQQQLSSMSPDEMKEMIDFFKGLDKASVKSKLRSKMGMDISDSQLDILKILTPELLQNLANSDLLKHYDPSLINNMDQNEFKMSFDRITGKSDEQLRSWASEIGLHNMDPQIMRNAMNMMKEYKEKNSSQSENLSNKNSQPPGASASSSTSSSQSDQKQASTPTTNTKQSTIEIGHIESLKVKGNDFFKKEQYDEAGTAYFEAILEIEEIRSKNKNVQDDELDFLEISCRLNYANIKAKEEDFDVVLSQATKVLAIKEHGKAYFRLGQAQFHLKKYEEALHNLNKAIPLLPGDTIASALRDKVQKALQEKGDSFIIEVKSEEEKAQSPPPRQESSGTMEDKVKQGQEKVNGMSPDQLKQMADHFKGMDKATLKSMMKAQTGTEMSDSQLEAVKMMMTPEMLLGISKVDFSQYFKPASQGTGVDSSSNASNSRPTPPVGMVDMMIQNPEKFKNLTRLIGEGDPDAKKLQNMSPEEITKHLKMMREGV